MEQHIAAYYKVLQQLATEAVSSDTLRDNLATVARKTASAMKAAGCSVLLFDAQRRSLLHAVSYGLSDWYLRKGFLDADKSLSDTLKGNVVTVLDAATDSRIQYREMAQRQRFTSVISVPLKQGENVIGALRVYTHEQRHFSNDDIKFLTAVAGLAATAVEKARLHQLTAGSPVTSSDALPSQTGSPGIPQDLIRPVSFFHPSEEEFARLLDFYKIGWMYEPRSFPLGWNNNDSVKEMFTPDFYLPELDLYIELTTMKQALLREKKRKMRLMKELYPEVNIKLLNKRDYHHLLAKYGYGPLGRAEVDVEKVFLSASQIHSRVRQLGKAISRDYAGKSPLLVGVLKGVVCFMSDLMRSISLPLSVDFIAISYYGDSQTENVRIISGVDKSIAGVDVIMVEDIVDTGMTLNFVLSQLAIHKPASLEVCTLLDKRVRRLVDVPIKYVGFEVPDEFVVGYGLDYNGEFRNLPFIGTVTPIQPTTSGGGDQTGGSHSGDKINRKCPE